MSDFVQRIYDFNKDNGLLERGYDDFLECSFQVEEALEHLYFEPLLGILEDSHPKYSVTSPHEVISAKDVSRAILTHCIEPIDGRTLSDTCIADVDRLDKACDAIVFAVGSMAKLGLTSTQIHEALNIVMDANLAKSGCPKDSEGKLLKPDNFPDPEPRLQELLDSRS